MRQYAAKLQDKTESQNKSGHTNLRNRTTAILINLQSKRSDRQYSMLQKQDQNATDVFCCDRRLVLPSASETDR